MSIDVEADVDVFLYQPTVWVLFSNLKIYFWDRSWRMFFPVPQKFLSQSRRRGFNLPKFLLPLHRSQSPPCFLSPAVAGIIRQPRGTLLWAIRAVSRKVKPTSSEKVFEKWLRLVDVRNRIRPDFVARDGFDEAEQNCNSWTCKITFCSFLEVV